MTQISQHFVDTSSSILSFSAFSRACQSMRTLIGSHEVDMLYRASELGVSVVGHNVDNAKHVYT